MIYEPLPDRLAHLKPKLSKDPWHRDMQAAGRVHRIRDEAPAHLESYQNRQPSLDVAAVVRVQPNSVFALGGMGGTPMTS